MLKQVLSEGRKEGARVFFDGWRLECRIGLIMHGCVDDLEEICGPQSWSQDLKIRLKHVYRKHRFFF